MAVIFRSTIRTLKHCISVERNCVLARKHFSTSLTKYIKVGDIATTVRTFSEGDVTAFAEVTGDRNPLHLDPEFARRSQFSGCVVHGCFTLGLVSGLIARELPGPGSILLKQTVEYPAPLMVGEEVRVSVKLLSYRHSIAKLDLVCKAPGEKVVLTGQVLVKYEQTGK